MLPLVAFALDLDALEAVHESGPPALLEALARLGAGLDLQPNHARPTDAAWVFLSARQWRSDTFDLLALDDEVWRRTERAGSCHIRLGGDGPADRRLNGRQILGTMRQVLTRYQRFLRWRNPVSSNPLFDRVLALHARLHDRSKPLVAADYDHTLDTWRWTLRLEPRASFAVQVAALFHDVERLYTEAEARVEHRAADYGAFKAAHAAAGAQIVAELLASIEVPLLERQQICELVARHEVGDAGDAPELRSPCQTGLAHSDAAPGPERALLNEADALSFFSLNASGFLRYFGPEHTARKVSYTLRRLGRVGRRELHRLKLAAPIRALVEGAAS